MPVSEGLLEGRVWSWVLKEEEPGLAARRGSVSRLGSILGKMLNLSESQIPQLEKENDGGKEYLSTIEN